MTLKKFNVHLPMSKLWCHSLKWKSIVSHFDEIPSLAALEVVKSTQVQCSQWLKFRQNGNNFRLSTYGNDDFRPYRSQPHRTTALQWRHNEHDGVSITSVSMVYLSVSSAANQRKHHWKLRVTGLCAENSPVTGEFPARRPSNAENVSIWWRHHGPPIMRFYISMNENVSDKSANIMPLHVSR